jgi:hypothetical protein
MPDTNRFKPTYIGQDPSVAAGEMFGTFIPENNSEDLDEMVACATTPGGPPHLSIGAMETKMSVDDVSPIDSGTDGNDNGQFVQAQQMDVDDDASVKIEKGTDEDVAVSSIENGNDANGDAQLVQAEQMDVDDDASVKIEKNKDEDVEESTIES